MIEGEAKPARDENGRLLPGNTANPSGKNGQKGKPDLTTRREYFETHYTSGDLLELYKDKERFYKLSPMDTGIVRHLIATFEDGNERGIERERYYDREYGKPVQRVDLKNTHESALEELEQEDGSEREES